MNAFHRVKAQARENSRKNALIEAQWDTETFIEEVRLDIAVEDMLWEQEMARQELAWVEAPSVAPQQFDWRVFAVKVACAVPVVAVIATLIF